MRTLVAVVGCHRSGTSAMAGTLAHLGLDLGPDLLGAGSDGTNPDGHYESLPVMRAHDKLLRALGLDWDVEALPKHQPKKWGTLVARTSLVNTVRQCGGDVFALKDPRMCLFPALWVEVAKLADLRLAPLYVLRTPDAIVRSLQKRNAFKVGHAQRVVRAHLAGIRWWMDMVGRGYTIQYGGLLGDWRNAIGHAFETLGIPDTVSAEQAQAVESFLNPEHNHHGS